MEIGERVINLQGRIHRTASHIFASQPVPGLAEVEDIQQQISLRILERASVIDGLDNQKDAYLMIDGARNGGGRLCVKETTYLRHVDTLEVLRLKLGDLPTDEDLDNDPLEYMQFSNDRPVEDQVEQREATRAIIDRIKLLSPKTQEVVIYSMNGISDANTAEILGVDRSAICQRRAKLKKLKREFEEENI